MALCPECGGSVPPAHFVAVSPGPVRCRWCNARVRLPRWGRLLRDALASLLGSAAVVGAGIGYFENKDPLWPIAGLLGLTVALAMAWLIEFFVPLETLAGRSVSPVKVATHLPYDGELTPHPDKPSAASGDRS